MVGYNYEPIKGDFPPQFEPGDAEERQAKLCAI
jgi:hypothetical protein